jgi:hypothetical protein
MESKIQKPRQSNRKGEVAEGLTGSRKSVACVKRNTRELGRPNSFLAVREVSEADGNDRGTDDELGVRSAHSTRRRESRSQGEGADVIRSQQRKH